MTAQQTIPAKIKRFSLSAPKAARTINVNCINNKQDNANYTPNRVRTSKYTIWSFLPKNLFEQFHGAANFYFLSLVILQAFPLFAEVPIIVSALPVIIIFSATAIKDGLEDMKRHKADKGVNSAHTYLLDDWVNLNYKNQLDSKTKFQIPKLKADIPETPLRLFPKNYLVKEENIATPASFKCPENWKLSEWKDIRVGDFILLRNNDSIPADIVIISSGETDSTCFVETKNLDGETNLKIKRGIQGYSHIKTPVDCRTIKCIIEAEPPNPNLYTFNGSISIIDETANEKSVLAIGPSGMLLRGCILRNTAWVIGIAVYTGSDTKIMLNSGPTPSKRSRVDRQINPQSFLIQEDLEMWDPSSETSAQPKAWNLCDDLGQIEYIFSDKTGTLTSNTMEFRKASINGVLYGMSVRNADQSKHLPNTVSSQEKLMEDQTLMKSKFAALKNSKGDSFVPRYVDKNLSFIDSKIPIHLLQNGVQSVKIREFFSLLAVCHTVLVEKPEPEDPDQDTIFYRAQSPDEAALVAAAKNMGFACLCRTDNKVEIDLLGESRTYTILNIMEFNSDRKRMSVIVERPEGEIILLCKGADSVIYERLLQEGNEELKEVTNNHLAMFANDGTVYNNNGNLGLRTLCLGYRVLGREEYNEWNAKYRKAQAAIVNREAECDAVANLIENNFTLMGATAIEDKLQDGVPNCIATLAKAGIKLWVLTGDKMETAINIGFSCNLLQKSMILIVIQSNSTEETLSQLKEALNRFWTEKGDAIGTSDFALVIDGASLKYGLEMPCKPLLLELGCRCKAVLCCRVSPLQKAMVVKLVREGLGAMCLAIGDGANDVSMIQAADIGIGISGKEGLQAVMASDYAISQFRFLSRLLLVHGRWAYIRSSELALNYYYKNMMWLCILFWHQFSAGLAMDFTYSMFFNTVFTILPTILVGIFDQDINSDISLALPQIYMKGIRQEMFNTRRYWVYMFHGIYQSVVCYFGVVFISYDASFSSSMYGMDSSSISTMVACAAIVTINVFSTTNWYNWTWITHISFWFSMASWILYLASYSSASSIKGFEKYLANSTTFIFGLILIVFVSLLPRLLIKYLQQQDHPSDTDILQEMHKFKTKAIDIHAHTGTETLSMTEKTSKGFFDSFVTSRSKTDLAGIAKSHSRNDLDQLHKAKADSPEKELVHIESDGFGTPTSKLPKIHLTKSPLNNLKEFGKESSHPLEDHGRQSSISSVIKSGVQKASQFFKTKHLDERPKTQRAGSLVYMGSGKEAVPNTGFAFSQDCGMEDIITPRRMALDPIQEDTPEDDESKKKEIGPSRLRNISKSIKSVLGINLLLTSSYRSLNNLGKSHLHHSHTSELVKGDGKTGSKDILPPHISIDLPVKGASNAASHDQIHKDTSERQRRASENNIPRRLSVTLSSPRRISLDSPIKMVTDDNRPSISQRSLRSQPQDESRRSSVHSRTDESNRRRPSTAPVILRSSLARQNSRSIIQKSRSPVDYEFNTDQKNATPSISIHSPDSPAAVDHRSSDSNLPTDGIQHHRTASDPQEHVDEVVETYPSTTNNNRDILTSIQPALSVDVETEVSQEVITPDQEDSAK
ncbi:hypothetical protein HDV02_000371 [Globomyces sp. JEL0801]|nr:hypothetical protein HDV02_000371 [Globomyces sp. JEL0801]